MKTVKIYQIKNTRECPYSFMSWDYAKDKLNIEDYIIVANFSAPEDISINKVLDTVYMDGNNGLLKRHFWDMRSISVSDIIEIDNKKYYVDTFGFAEVE